MIQLGGVVGNAAVYCPVAVWKVFLFGWHVVINSDLDSCDHVPSQCSLLLRPKHEWILMLEFNSWLCFVCVCGWITVWFEEHEAKSSHLLCHL